MVPISSKRRQRITNDESQAIISTKSKMMVEVVTSNSHDTQDDKTTISTSHTNQIPTKVQCCSICNKNNARYKCPRCNISHCSVSCYQIHDGTSGTSNTADSSNNRKLCTESFHKRHVLTTNNTSTNNRVQSVLSSIHNDININLDKLEQRDEGITNLIQNDTKNVEIVNGMMEEIKDNVCKSESLLNVFRIDQLNNSKVDEVVVHEISSRFKQEDRVQEQQQDVKKDDLSIDLLISGMNAMDGDNTAGDSDMISSGILNLGLGNSNQRPLVVEDEMVSISTIHKK